MAGSGPHQISSYHAELANVHQQGELHDLEHRNNMDTQQEGSLQTTQVEVVIEEDVNQYMSKLMKKLCNEKLMI